MAYSNLKGQLLVTLVVFAWVAAIMVPAACFDLEWLSGVFAAGPFALLAILLPLKARSF